MRSVVILLIFASCAPWSNRLGQVDLPVPEEDTRDLAVRPLDGVTPPEKRQGVEEARKQIAKRKAVDEGELPRALRESDGALTPLGIAELRQMVLSNNLDLEVALFDPKIAGVRVDSEIARFDAVIGSRFKFGNQDLPEIDGPLAKFTADDPGLDGQLVKLTEVEQRRRALGLGVDFRLPLPTGGVIALQGGVDEKTITDPRRFEQYLAATRFSLSQPLLRNAGPDAALASLRIARADERIVQVRTKLAALRVLALAEKAYWRLYAARRVLNVRSEQFRLAQENLRVVRNRVREGISPRVEITRTELGVYSRLEGLVIAETAWRLRQRELKAMLNSARFPLAGGRMIEPSTEPMLANLELDPERLVRDARGGRLELLDAELRVVRDGLAVKLRENQVLPIVNLDFHYGLGARGSDLGRAWESQWDFERPDYGVGITFRMPIGNRLPRARLREALLLRSKSLASLQAREMMVRTEILNGADTVARNWQRIVAARQNVLAAGVNYDAERRQFEQGLRTMREVFEALGELGSAQLREVRAIVEYQVAQIDLAFATGTLLGYARIDIGSLQLPRR